MCRQMYRLIDSSVYHTRWGFTPLVEAKRFRHEGVVDYLVKFLHNKCPLESLN